MGKMVRGSVTGRGQQRGEGSQARYALAIRQ